LNPINPIKQFFAVFEYELKQAFLSTKAILTLSSLVFLTSTLIYWIYRLEIAMKSQMTRDEIKATEVFKKIFSSNFYDAYPFLEGVPLYIIFLQLCSLTFIPLFILILSYDITSNELRDKTFRYFAFRCNVLTICIGKYLAYAAQFAVITAILWSLALCYNKWHEPDLDLSLSISYIFHFWSIDQFMNLFVIAFSLCVSCSFRNPLLANLLILFFSAYLFMKLDFLNKFAYRVF